MPNETLIEQLESLREGYTRQQKKAANMQGVLKAAAKFQSRIQKASADYKETNTAIDPSGLSQIINREAIDPLLPGLRREIKAFAPVVVALKTAASALRSEPTDVVRLDKAIQALKVSPQPGLDSVVAELAQELEIGQRALRDEFGQKLNDAFAQMGLNLGRTGAKFTVGRFELEPNFAKRALVLRYGVDVVVPRAPLTVEGAVDAYRKAAKLVLERQTDGKAWIEQFHRAHTLAGRKLQGDTGRVNIVDCYLEMVILRQGKAFFAEPSKRSLAEYTRAEFIHDFYEFSARQRQSADGRYVKANSATKSQTDNPAKSMWIVEGESPYEGRYIADIEFVKE